MLSNYGAGKDSWESLGQQGDQPVNSKGDQPWIFIRRTDAEALVRWPPDAKSWLIWKDPDAGKDWGQEEKETPEDEMVGRHHQFNGHEFVQSPGGSEGQGSLACCSPWGRKESDTTEGLNNSKKMVWKSGRADNGELIVSINHLLTAIHTSANSLFLLQIFASLAKSNHQGTSFSLCFLVLLC